ncbi:MAG: hypothetical protein ACK5Q7_09495 [Cyanobacteriota bacterium]
MALRRKMALHRANGARLGWLLFPEERVAESWRAAAEGAWQWAAHRSGSRRLNPRSLPELLDLDSRSARTG